MIRAEYAADLNDEDWNAAEGLIPSACEGGRTRSADIREILNAVFYILRAGCA
ncbi:MAG: transposase, partial [Synergistaceae bacterium]|nr:transposase [Synergistaceae bacterium]